MKTIICENSQLDSEAADLINRGNGKSPDAVLALACGRP